MTSPERSTRPSRAATALDAGASSSRESVDAEGDAPISARELARESDPASNGRTPQRSGSSIRPAPPSWQSAGPRVTPPAPMVVVYSGQSERPAPRWDEDPERSARTTQLDFEPVSSLHAQGFLSDEGGAEPRALPGANIPLAPRPYTPPTPETYAAWPANRDSSPDGPYSSIRARSERRRWRGWWLGGIALAAGIGVGVFVSMRGESSPSAAAPRIASPESPQALPPPAPSAPVQRPPSASAEAAKPSPTPSAAAEGKPPSASESNAHRVTLEVFPADAKVIRRGVGYPGPPYVFSVPKGKRLAVEVARDGFVTRRVVLDGSESTVIVGLIRKRSRRRADLSAPLEPLLLDEPTAVVQSGPAR